MTDNPNITLDMNRIPEHIAVIMDGNGRWATERGKERSYGHQAGVETVRRITSECTRLGVKYLATRVEIFFTALVISHLDE